MGEDREHSELDIEGHWKSRPTAARALAVGIAALPVLVSVVFALLVEILVPEPSGTFARVSWWIGLFGLSSIVFFISERAARRAVPLGILLELGLVFPGRTPERLAIARRARGTRDVGHLLAEARSMTADADPVAAARSVVTLAVGANARDRKTRRSASRVRAIADLIGSELGLTNGERDRLRWSVLLHDVGKLGVHSEVSNMQGSLPPAERDLTRDHPFEGARLAPHLEDWLGDWGSAIVEHRERFDGDGYPYGLVGDEISLGGRIVAVAGAYDAMTSVRSHGSPISQDAARAEIARRGGAQFDPTVVRAFLAVPAQRRATFSPVAWLGILPSSFDGFELTSVCRVAAVLAVLGSVLGFAAWGSSPSHPNETALSRTPKAAGATSNAPAVSGTSTTSGRSSSTTLRDAQVVDARRSGARSHSEPSDRQGQDQSASLTGASKSAGGSTDTTGSSDGSSPGSGDPPSTSTTLSGTTSTTGSSPGTTTPPTSGGPPPPPPPSTTTTTIPAPSAVTNLSATASCSEVLLAPQISLRWTDSTSSWVTSYEILRSSDGSDYDPIATVSPHASSFTDSQVSGLGTTYWYEVRAVSPEGSSTSRSVSATTPVTCL